MMTWNVVRSPRRAGSRAGLFLLALILAGAASSAWSTEVPEACFGFDVGGGDPSVPSADVTFDNTCSVIPAASGARFYRRIWEFNAPCPDTGQINPNVIVTGAGNLTSAVVVDGGPNGALETVPGGDDIVVGTTIEAGANGIADTIVQNIIIRPGPDGVLDPTTTIVGGDDFVDVDMDPASADFGKPVVKDGGNLIAESQIHVIVSDGGDGVLNTAVPAPGSDDVRDATFRIIYDGGDLSADTTADPADSQVTPVGGPFSDDVQVIALGGSGVAAGFTDDVQVTPFGGQAGVPGDDTGWVGPAGPGGPDPAGILGTIGPVTYTWPNATPVDVDQIVCVRLTVKIALDANGTGMTTSVITRKVRLTFANFPPTVQLDLSALAPTQASVGQAPFALSVNADTSFDQDGYFLWGGIDWGDGTFTELTALQLAALPELLGDLTKPGGYTIPGIYKVTLFLIDNGRVPLGNSFVGFSGDPQGALANAITLQATIGNPSGPTGPNGQSLNPMLRESHQFIRVLGNFSVRRGRFIVKLDPAAGRDSFFLTLKPFGATAPFTDVTFPTSAPVTVTLGTAVIGTGTPNKRGFFRDPVTKMIFRFNKRRHRITFRIRRTDLFRGPADLLLFKQGLPPPSITTATTGVVNGFADVLVTITGLVDSTGAPVTMVGMVRFVYRTRRARIGIGTLPRSLPDPG